MSKVKTLGPDTDTYMASQGDNIALLEVAAKAATPTPLSTLTPEEYNRGHLLKNPLRSSERPIGKKTQEARIKALNPEPESAKRTMVVDWLSLNLEVDLLRMLRISDEGIKLFLLEDMKYEEGDAFALHEDADVQLVHSGGGTQRHKHRFFAVLDGHIVGEVCAFPRLGYISKELCQFKVENFMFYTRDWVSDIQRTIEGLGATLHSVSELHIAHDSPENEAVMSMIDEWHFSRGEAYEPLGKTNFHPFFDTKSRHEVHGFTWGSKNSMKRLTCYDKTDHLEKRETTKRYISDFHKLNGLQGADGKNVIRCELKLKQKAVKKVKDFDWTKLESPDYLASIFQFHTANWFEFVKRERGKEAGDKNRNRRDRFCPICFDGFSSKTLEREKHRPKDTKYGVRITIKTLYKEYQRTKVEAYREAALSLVNMNGLQIWYFDKVPYWDRELEDILQRSTAPQTLAKTGTEP